MKYKEAHIYYLQERNGQFWFVPLSVWSSVHYQCFTTKLKQAKNPSSNNTSLDVTYQWIGYLIKSQQKIPIHKYISLCKMSRFPCRTYIAE